jgi:DNA uptake protein ComE-like DNA-binding protein
MDMRVSIGISILAIVSICGLAAGCTPNKNPEEVREQTAKATAELKTNAKAVAAGIREGWSRDKPLDLNTATREQLVSLPMTGVEADAVIAGRPYDDPDQLVSRHILSQARYDKISDRLTAKKIIN